MTDVPVRKRLRLTYVCMDAPVPARSGYALRVQTVAAALSGLADLRLLCLMSKADPHGVASTRARHEADFVTAPARGRLAKGLTHAAAVLANRNRWMEKFSAPPARAEAMAAIAAHAPDFVVMGHMATTGLRRTYALPPARTIIDHHNVESLNYARMRRRRSGFGRLVAAIDERALVRLERRAADARDHWAVSDVDRALLEAILSVPVLTVPNVAPASAFRIVARGVGRDAPAAVGFMATYGYYPNVDAALELCEIVTLLRRSGVAVAATALGAHAPPHLVRAAAEAGVALPGFVEDATAILESFTVLLAPIRSGSGTKLKIIEALAMGIPVVTTPIGAEGIPVAREEMGIVAGTTAALAEAVRELLHDRTRAAAMGASARRWARENASVPALTTILERRLAELAGG